MQTVKVKKKDLLERLRENKNNHKKLFLDAMDVYRQEVIVELDKMIEKAKKGSKIQTFVSIPEPEEHTSDYDSVISMLEMSVDSEVVLSSHEFRTYVLNQWGWINTFASNTVSYANKKIS